VLLLLLLMQTSDAKRQQQVLQQKLSAEEHGVTSLQTELASVKVGCAALL
jgi:hypothetical protein